MKNAFFASSTTSCFILDHRDSHQSSMRCPNNVMFCGRERKAAAAAAAAVHNGVGDDKPLL